MDVDERREIVQGVQGELWEDRLQEAYRSGQLCAWVSSFHGDGLPCQLADKNPYYGSYNSGLKCSFNDGTAWLLRFARAGKIHESYIDEKVAMEVAVIDLIRRETTIPVPKIEAWGIAAQNPLGLGPFIIMEFIQGMSLNDLLKDINNGSRLLREDITDEEIEIIYRQFITILLQLFKLDFDRIGSLEPPSSNPELRFPIRPLTWKAHDILQTGGVNIFGDRDKGFSSTKEYFQHLAGQDWHQIVYQPDSIYGQYDAMAKYRSFKVLKSVIPMYINGAYDCLKFKVLCDDLGLANLMVRSRQDLTIIGVVDLEWSYTGPAQLFASAPWWLLMDRPTNQDWDCRHGEPIAIIDRYYKYLDIFERILQEEEARTLGYEEHEFSNLIRWSRQSGAMWVHMLLTLGFNDPGSFPFTKLIQHIGRVEWEKREREIHEDEVVAFGVRKARQLKQYEQDLQRIEADKLLVDRGEMDKKDFVAMYLHYTSTEIKGQDPTLLEESAARPGT